MYLLFEAEESFKSIFTDTFAEKYPSFENIELLPEIMTLEDYLIIRKNPKEHVKVRMLVEELQMNVNKEVKKRKQKEEKTKINTEVWF